MNDTPTQFADLKLDPKVLQAITEAGYTTPTPIQLGAIPPALEGRDVLGIAQTGTGKTAGFTLPMITLLGRGRARARMPRSLVLCPTRELAAQVAENFDIYSKYTRLTKALLIGGVSFGEQDKLIDRGVDVLIATPGRLLDHFERGKLLLTGVQIMVVDEADRMLDMGFIPDIERIFQLTPFTRQTLFFSATMAPEIERITDTFLHAPARIEVARQATASETITQKLLEITPTRKDQTAKQKRELLRATIDSEGARLKNAIIFCNRKTEVDVVAKSLKAHGYDAAPIHGDLDQSQRTRTLEGFREGKLRFLVASDVAARGLDIPAVSHVFNFDLPSHAEDYVHRIGRTGRAGLPGTAISLSVPADEKYLGAIEGLLKRSLPRAPLPEGFSLSEAAQAAPREKPERSGRDGGRGRNGRDRHEDRASEARRAQPEPRPAHEARSEPKAEPASKPQEAATREPRRDTAARRGRDSREERRDPLPHAKPEQRSESRAQNGSHDRRRDDRRDDRRPSAVGFGDHTPDFLNRSFRTAQSKGTDTEAETAKPTVQAVQAVPAEEAATSAAREPQKTSRSRSRRKPAAEKAAPVAAPHDAAEPKPEAVEAPATTGDETVTIREAATEAAVATETPVAAESAPEPAVEKPARAPRTRRAPKAAAEATEPAAEPTEEAAEKKPAAKRTRRKPAAAPDADAAASVEEADAPAPRRTRARRKPAADPAPDAPAVTEPEAEAPVVRDEA